MQNMLMKVMERWGTTLVLRKGTQEFTCKGFFQETGSKSWQNGEMLYSPFGEVPRGQYLYLGPAEPLAETGDVLLLSGNAFEVRRTELVRYGDTPMYCWGLCVKKGGEDTWASQS